MRTFIWATVTQLTPLRIKLDGDSAALPLTPDSLVDPTLFDLGDRVRCEMSNNRVIVYGAAGGPDLALSPILLAAAGARSKIINGACRLNQDGYVSGTAIPIGSYAFDGWKASGVVNLLTNPSAEGTLPAILNQGITLTKDSTWAQSRTNSFKMVATGASGDSFMSFGENATLASLGLVAGKTYTISGYCKVITPVSGTAAPNARARSITMIWNAGASEQSSPAFINTAGTITRVSTTFTVPIGTTNGYIRFYLGGTAGTVQWDALMLTEGPNLYPYFDGATTDCSWSGTADASTSYNVPNVVPTLTGTFDSNFGSLFTINANARVAQIVERSRVQAGNTITVNGGTAQIRVYNNLTPPGSRPAWTSGAVTFVADGTDDVVVEAFGGAAGATIGQVRMFAGTLDYGFSLQTVADELRDCQRYYVRSLLPASSTAAGHRFAYGYQASTTQAEAPVALQTTLRTTPVITFSSLVWTDSVNFNGAVSSISVYQDFVPSQPFVSVLIVFATNGAASRPGALSGPPGAWMALDARIR